MIKILIIITLKIQILIALNEQARKSLGIRIFSINWIKRGFELSIIGSKVFDTVLNEFCLIFAFKRMLHTLHILFRDVNNVKRTLEKNSDNIFRNSNFYWMFILIVSFDGICNKHNFSINTDEYFNWNVQ